MSVGIRDPALVVESLACPVCGAPLSLRSGATFVICHYCNSSLRVEPSTGEPNQTASSAPTAVPGPTRVTVDTSISPATVAQIRELTLLGKRDEALAVYEGEAHCDRATAEPIIDAWANEAAFDIELTEGRLTAVGVAISLGPFLLVAIGIALGIVMGSFWLLAGSIGALALLGAAWKLLSVPTALRTLRYFSASVGTATVVRFVVVGKDPENDPLFRLLLDVHEPSGSTFRTERLFVLSQAHAATMKEGARMRVKYFPGDPASVVYDGPQP
jgi:hypothetical protein